MTRNVRKDGLQWCEHCQLNVQNTAVVAHLAVDLMKIYSTIEDRRTGEMAFGQAVDMLSNLPDEDLVKAMSSIDALKDLGRKYDKTRRDIVAVYRPLGAWVEMSRSGEVVIHQDGRKICSSLQKKDEIMKMFMDLLNKEIDYGVGAMSLNIVVVDSGTNTCTNHGTIHVRVPPPWLGCNVKIMQYYDRDVEVTTKPVKCGNSVHVTVPHEWIPEDRTNILVIIHLDRIQSIDELMVGEVE